MDVVKSGKGGSKKSKKKADEQQVRMGDPDPNADVNMSIVIGAEGNKHMQLDQQKLVGFFQGVLNSLASLSDMADMRKIVITFDNKRVGSKIKPVNPQANINLQMYDPKTHVPVTYLLTMEEFDKIVKNQNKHKDEQGSDK